MTDTPPDWVLIEAAKRSELTWLLGDVEACIRAYKATHHFRALCDMIEKYEQPPVDRKLLCAREAYGPHDVIGQMKAVRAIELWESGYGSD
jgi:hypothetical protein